MKKHPIWFLIIGIFILIVPTAIYFGFLASRMQEEYVVLMSSGGIITAGGMYGANAIPEEMKFSGLYKMSARSFTLLSVITIVQKFIYQIIGLAATFIVCFVIFSILKEMWKNGRRRKQSSELAKEVSRNVVESIK